jgi:hypothetical protein
MRALALTLAASGLIAACASAPDGPVTETGELATGDLTHVRGVFYDRFTVRMGEGQWIKMDLRSPAFDPYLVFRTPGGQQSDMDDSTPGDTTRVELIHRAAEAGQYEIVVTSYASGESGAYTLVYEVTDDEPASGGTSTAGAAPARRPDRAERADEEEPEDGPAVEPDGLGPNVVRPAPEEDTVGLGGGIKI